MTRFTVDEVRLSEKHPQWPGAVFFKIYDATKQAYNWGCYKQQEIADKYCNQLNDKVSV